MCAVFDFPNAFPDVLSIKNTREGIKVIWAEVKDSVYELYKNEKTGNTGWVKAADGLSGTSYTDYGATLMGQRYRYRSRAVTGNVYSDYGTEKSIVRNPFSDVKASDGYFNALAWAYNNLIAGGYSDGTFRPGNTCSRANFTIMLWKLAGRPSPGNVSNPFSDVSKSLGANQYDSIMWAYKNGIINGYKDGTFKPNGNLTRAQIVLMLWKYAGQPNPGSVSNPFKDVSKSLGDNQYKAIMWAYKNGITKGTDSTHFSPGSPCKRSQIVTFLFKYDAVK